MATVDTESDAGAWEEHHALMREFARINSETKEQNEQATERS